MLPLKCFPAPVAACDELKLERNKDVVVVFDDCAADEDEAPATDFDNVSYHH
jgi:hypothetical protein